MLDLKYVKKTKTFKKWGHVTRKQVNKVRKLKTLRRVGNH